LSILCAISMRGIQSWAPAIFLKMLIANLLTFLLVCKPLIPYIFKTIFSPLIPNSLTFANFCKHFHSLCKHI
jgi:hypothetical protein